jgi:SAM-dependent methyltransferase
VEPTFSPAWFETFGRPEPAATAREVEFLARVLPPPPPATVLDVPCGFGRHAQALATRGYRVMGVERDPTVAAKARSSGVVVHEVDMRRLDDVSGSFPAVICMWASFGWFDDETNSDIFAAMSAKTADTLVLDLYTPAFFRTHQGRGTNRGVSESRRVEGNRLRTILDYPDGTRDEFEWRLYEPEELAELGGEVGLRLDLVCADFSQQPPTSEMPRTQLVFKRNT